MNEVVFYSWQSDCPNSTNRGFIEAALQRAVANIRDDESIKVEPVVQRDTQGLSGSPSIKAAILDRINAAAAVVCDVTFIGTLNGRKMPNPNVLVELGFAVHAKEWPNVILVFNTVSGDVTELPFDLHGQRALTYFATEGEENRSVEKKKLVGAFEDSLREIFKTLPIPIPPNPADLVRKLIEDGKIPSLRILVNSEVRKVVTALNVERFAPTEPANAETFKQRVLDYDSTCLPLAEVLATGCYFDSNPTLWVDSIEQIANALEVKMFQAVPSWWHWLNRYPAMIALYAGGIAAVAAEKYSTLAAILRKVTYYEHGSEAKPLSNELAWAKVKQQDVWHAHLVKARKGTSVSEHLWEILREPLKSLVPQQQRYDEAFDRFEFLYGLHVSDTFPMDDGVWGPIGSFVWRRRHDKSIAKEIKNEVHTNGDNTAVVKAKLVQGDATAFLKALSCVR